MVWWSQRSGNTGLSCRQRADLPLPGTPRGGCWESSLGGSSQPASPHHQPVSLHDGEANQELQLRSPQPTNTSHPRYLTGHFKWPSTPSYTITIYMYVYVSCLMSCRCIKISKISVRAGGQNYCCYVIVNIITVIFMLYLFKKIVASNVLKSWDEIFLLSILKECRVEHRARYICRPINSE